MRRVKPAARDLVFSVTSRSVQVTRSKDAVSHGNHMITCGAGPKQSHPWSRSYYNNSGFGDPGLYPGPTSNVNDLLGKIKGVSVNLAMALAEYRKTANTFVQLVGGLHTMATDIKRGRLLRMLAKGTKSSPNTWLMYRYGIMPFLYDMQGALEVLDTKGNRDTDPVKVSKSYQVSGKVTSQPITMVSTTFKEVTEYHNKRRLTAYVQYSNDLLGKASQLGLLNPAALAWELVPFSFVVDWFIDVGGYLSALDAMSGVERSSAFYVDRFRTTTRYLGPAPALAEIYYYYRGPLSLTPSPPSYSPSLSARRIADSLALLHNLRR